MKLLQKNCPKPSIMIVYLSFPELLTDDCINLLEDGIQCSQWPNLVAHMCLDPCRATQCRARNVAAIPPVSDVAKKPCRTHLATPLSLCHGKFQQVLNPTPINPTPATCHKRKQKLRCNLRNAALQKLNCNIGFSAVQTSF